MRTEIIIKLTFEYEQVLSYLCSYDEPFFSLKNNWLKNEQRHIVRVLAMAKYDATLQEMAHFESNWLQQKVSLNMILDSRNVYLSLARKGEIDEQLEFLQLMHQGNLQGFVQKQIEQVIARS